MSILPAVAFVTCLLFHLASCSLDDILKVVKTINEADNEKGEVTYMGRTIHWSTKGRVHSLEELWVYDGTAWDVASGTSVMAKHYDKAHEARQAAVDKLITELKQKGIIKDNVQEPKESPANNERKPTESPTGDSKKEDIPVKDKGQHQDQGQSEKDHVSGTDEVNKNKDIPGRNNNSKTEINPPWFVTLVWDYTSQFAYGIVFTSVIGVLVILVVQCQAFQGGIWQKGGQNSNKTKIRNDKLKGPVHFEDFDDVMEVEPDDVGSYTACHVKAAKPTPEQLRGQENYSMCTPLKGLAYILNNFNFPDRPRNGSKLDFDNMKHLFDELGYSIQDFENLTSMGIKESIKTFAGKFNEADADYNSAVIVLMSHGDTGYILGTDNEPVRLKEIQEEFEGGSCPKLQGKPKLFFVQACRGQRISTASYKEKLEHDGLTTPSGTVDTGYEVDAPETDDNFARDVPDNADMHFAYATTEGFLSLRSKVAGSWFIQVITEVFLAHAHEESLDNLMNKVTNRVSGLKGKLYDPQTGKRVLAKQTPERVNRMRKTFYFLPKYPPTY